MDDSLLNQNLEDLIKTLQGLSKKLDKTYSTKRDTRVRSGNLANKSKSGIDYGKHAKKLVGFGFSTVNKSANKVASSLTKLAGSSNDLLNLFKDVAGLVVVGRVLNDLIDGGIDLSKSYTNLTNIGQQFGGSLSQMTLQAAKAGLPLEAFGEMLQRQSTAAAVMNNLGPNNGMGMFAARVKENLAPMGFYGMTVEQLNDVTADYLETLRKQNLLTIQNRITNQQSVTDFASAISEFSTVTGVARDKIAETANQALNNTSLQEMNLSPAQMKKISVATAGLASLPGDTGSALANALTQTIGLGGARFSDLGKELYSAGQGQIVQYLQTYANKVQAGTATKSDLAQFVTELQQSNLSNSQFIRAQMMAGNQSVAQVGELLTNLNGITASDFLKDNTAATGLMKFFSTLQNTLYGLETDFSTGFYGIIKNIDGNMGDFGNVLTTKIGPIMDFFGQIAGTLIVNLYNLLTSSASQQWFKTFGAFIKTRITPTALKKDFADLQIIFKDLAKLFTLLGKSLNWVVNHPKTSIAVGAVGAVGATALAAMAIFKRTRYVGYMKVDAAIVKIGGKGLGDFFDKIGGKKGAKEAETAGEDIAEDTAAAPKKGFLNRTLESLKKMGKFGGKNTAETAGKDVKNTTKLLDDSGKIGKIGGLGKDAEIAGEDVTKNTGFMSKLSDLVKIGKWGRFGGVATEGAEVAGESIAGEAALDAGAVVGAGLLGISAPVWGTIAAAAMGTGAILYGGYRLYKHFENKKKPDILPYSNIKEENLAQLKTQYASVQQQLVEEQKLATDNRGNSKLQAVILGKIADLVKEQNDIQKAIGSKTIDNQRKQETIAKQTAQSVKRIQ